MGIKKKKSRNFGHEKGIEVVQKIIETSIEENIKYLTLYAFSTENWKRPIKEINFLMNLLSSYFDNNIQKLVEKKIKIKVIGNINKFPKFVKKKLILVQKKTKQNKLIQVNLALNYGFKDEIIRSFKIINKKSLKVNKINIKKNLYTKNITDPEILIRTGGTNRLSNFLLWQIAYSEIFFVKKLWPDFNKKDFKFIINQYKKINRKFGAI